jgi:hypothetical protein
MMIGHALRLLYLMFVLWGSIIRSRLARLAG